MHPSSSVALAPKLPLSLLIRIFVPFICGYFLSYLLRVVNTVLAGDLAHDLDIDAGQLGLLTSVYFITFAIAQLPLGILLDRYGPRRTESLLLLFAALGAGIFAYASQFNGLLLGRALIGLGVSACLMASFKAFVQWFPTDKLPLINGIFMMSGGLGVLTASKPVEFALGFTDWRGVFWILAACLLVTSALVWFMVPRRAEQDPAKPFSYYVEGFVTVFTSKQFWIIAPWAVASQATILSTSGLWAGPWLRDVAHYNRDEVATTLFVIGLSVILGFGAIGFLAERITRRGYSTFQVCAVGMTCYMILQLLLVFEITNHPTLLWAGIGFFGTSGALIYAALSQMFANELAGRVNTAFNLLVFLCAFTAQWGIGEIVNVYSELGAVNYAQHGYQIAFAGLLGFQIITMLVYLKLKNRLRS
ncbi:MAG: putative MFS family arabinose efflux permease [Saprospiraceae bacterium]|jgi:predicted MFS family arabinose efflux permease